MESVQLELQGVKRWSRFPCKEAWMRAVNVWCEVVKTVNAYLNAKIGSCENNFLIVWLQEKMCKIWWIFSFLETKIECCHRKHRHVRPRAERTKWILVERFKINSIPHWTMFHYRVHLCNFSVFREINVYERRTYRLDRDAYKH